MRHKLNAQQNWVNITKKNVKLALVKLVNFFPVTVPLGLQIMASPMKGGNIKKIGWWFKK